MHLHGHDPDPHRLRKNNHGDEGETLNNSTANKMNEIGPHRLWAERLVARAAAYGVIENKQEYIKLFGIH